MVEEQGTDAREGEGMVNHRADDEQPNRCPWAYASDLMVVYHDTEWGLAITSDQILFERLILEGFQAGLSWRTILHKRENFRRALDDFDPERMARYDQAKIEALMQDAGIVRNRLKLQGAVQNAQAYLALCSQVGSFRDWIWQFSESPHPGRPAPRALEEIPTQTHQSRRMAKALRQAGFTFVGATICYAFMQSAGLVNDHLAHCFRAKAAPDAG